MQIATNATGLTTSNGGAITYETAVAAIAKLRDVLGGTASASVENALTRTPTSYTSSVNSTGPVLFAVNSAAVAYVRSPYQVCDTVAIKVHQGRVYLHQKTLQVLDIVYFSNTTTPGGFFPHGVNGASAMPSVLFVHMSHNALTEICSDVAGNSALASPSATPADKRCATTS